MKNMWLLKKKKEKTYYMEYFKIWQRVESTIFCHWGINEKQQQKDNCIFLIPAWSNLK